MSIDCGTDFSESSADAVEAAAMFARRLSGPLLVVHAMNDQSQKSLPGEVRDSLALYARAQYHDQCERLRALNVNSVDSFHFGSPETVLIREAANNRGECREAAEVPIAESVARPQKFLLASTPRLASANRRTPVRATRIRILEIQAKDGRKPGLESVRPQHDPVSSCDVKAVP